MGWNRIKEQCWVGLHDRPFAGEVTSCSTVHGVLFCKTTIFSYYLVFGYLKTSLADGVNPVANIFI